MRSTTERKRRPRNGHDSTTQSTYAHAPSFAPPTQGFVGERRSDERAAAEAENLDRAAAEARCKKKRGNRKERAGGSGGIGIHLGMVPSGSMPCSRQQSSQQALPTWIPAWPMWMLMISLISLALRRSSSLSSSRRGFFLWQGASTLSLLFPKCVRSGDKKGRRREKEGTRDLGRERLLLQEPARLRGRCSREPAGRAGRSVPCPVR